VDVNYGGNPWEEEWYADDRRITKPGPFIEWSNLHVTPWGNCGDTISSLKVEWIP
jgi:hypothetical protein